jgi:hypothetical protein
LKLEVCNAFKFRVVVIWVTTLYRLIDGNESVRGTYSSDPQNNLPTTKPHNVHIEDYNPRTNFLCHNNTSNLNEIHVWDFFFCRATVQIGPTPPQC